MPQNQHRRDRVTIIQSQNIPDSMSAYCAHKDELKIHASTTVNSYVPVRCLRMGAFCIVLRENFSPAMVADLVFYVFLRRKREKLYSESTGHEGRRVK